MWNFLSLFNQISRCGWTGKEIYIYIRVYIYICRAYFSPTNWIIVHNYGETSFVVLLELSVSILNFSVRILNLSSSIWILHPEFWILHPVFWILHPEFLILHPEFWILLPVFWVMLPVFCILHRIFFYISINENHASSSIILKVFSISYKIHSIRNPLWDWQYSASPLWNWQYSASPVKFPVLIIPLNRCQFSWSRIENYASCL